MQVGDFLHAEPAELGAADRARHVIARAVDHLDDQNVAAWTNLNEVKIKNSGSIPVCEPSIRKRD